MLHFASESRVVISEVAPSLEYKLTFEWIWTRPYKGGCFSVGCRCFTKCIILGCLSQFGRIQHQTEPINGARFVIAAAKVLALRDIAGI